jgi:hypothetical protein
MTARRKDVPDRIVALSGIGRSALARHLGIPVRTLDWFARAGAGESAYERLLPMLEKIESALATYKRRNDAGEPMLVEELVGLLIKHADEVESVSRPTAPTPAEIFATLWEWAEKDTNVAYSVLPNDQAGCFYVLLEAPQIHLHRARPPHAHHKPDLTGPVLQDLITLAHEFGHFCSWREADRGATEGWGAYARATEVRGRKEPLSASQQECVIAEERLAWDIAERTLMVLGLDTWDEFRRLKAIGLARNAAEIGLEA